MVALDNVLEQALRLSDEERGELIERLLRSFDPDAGADVDGPEREAAWSEEIDHRVAEIREGKVALVDGEEARARVRAAISRVRGGRTGSTRPPSWPLRITSGAPATDWDACGSAWTRARRRTAPADDRDCDSIVA